MSVPALFLDANIFVAAAASPRGGSRLLFDLARAGRVKIITTAHALREADRNITRKLAAPAYRIYEEILLEVPPSLQALEGITHAHVAFAERLVPPKDVPILLGALASGCEFLITLDRKDFLENKNLLQAPLSFIITTPGRFIETFARQEHFLD